MWGINSLVKTVYCLNQLTTEVGNSSSENLLPIAQKTTVNYISAFSHPSHEDSHTAHCVVFVHFFS